MVKVYYSYSFSEPIGIVSSRICNFAIDPKRTSLNTQANYSSPPAANTSSSSPSKLHKKSHISTNQAKTSQSDISKSPPLDSTPPTKTEKSQYGILTPTSSSPASTCINQQYPPWPSAKMRRDWSPVVWMEASSSGIYSQNNNKLCTSFMMKQSCTRQCYYSGRISLDSLQGKADQCDTICGKGWIL